MKAKGKISIREIAELSGVSVATVSRIINKSGRFSEKTKEKVMKIIDEYNYKPNMAAKSLRENKSKTIGITVPDINNGFFSEVISEIEKFFYDEGYSVFICNTNRDDEKEAEYFKSLDSKLVDGIICISGNSSSHGELVKRNIPIVYINNCGNDDIYCIESDHFEGGFAATEELIKEGCKRILLLTNERGDMATLSKHRGYLAALDEYLIEPDADLIQWIPLKSGNFEDALERVTDIVKSGLEFDGIFATNDWRAHGALVALQHLKIDVPDKIKIIGYDGTYVSKYCNPPISTIYQNKKELAYKASTLLLNLIRGIAVSEDKHIVLPVDLIMRGTTK